jgi:hypothetical protein
MCSRVTISSSSHTTLFTYFIDGIAVQRHNSFFDLGITIGSDLSFDQHINNIVSKVLQRVGILFRQFLYRNLSSMRQAFITYIHPVLAYNSIAWNPTFIYLIDLTGKRNFTKRRPTLSSLPYSERHALPDLELLELRRLRFDLI